MKIELQDVTSVIDLISPLESNNHHSVTVTTRWVVLNISFRLRG